MLQIEQRGSARRPSFEEVDDEDHGRHSIDFWDSLNKAPCADNPDNAAADSGASGIAAPLRGDVSGAAAAAVAAVMVTDDGSRVTAANHRKPPSALGGGEAAADAAADDEEEDDNKPTTPDAVHAVAFTATLSAKFARRPPLVRTLSADEALRQVVASMVYAFAFGTSDKVIAKLAPMVSDVASRQSVLYAVFYVILVAFFCPTFGRMTRGADLNPTGLVVAVLYGELSPLAFIEKLVLIVLGATCGLHLTNHFKWYVYDDAVKMMAHRGSFAGALGAEAASSFVVFFVSRAVSAPVFGEYMWLFDKLVYIVVFHWEACAYSCAILNPAVSLANTIVVHGPSHYLHASAWWAVAPYCLGGPAGCFAARAAVDAARVAVRAARVAVQKKKKD